MVNSIKKSSLFQRGVENPKKLIMVCFQRSGSNLMTGLMNADPKFLNIGQAFKREPNYVRKLNETGKVEFEGLRYDNGLAYKAHFYQLEKAPSGREKRNTIAYIRGLFDGFHAQQPHKGVLMIKVHGATLYQDEFRELMDSGEYSFLVLYRENYLKNAISWYVATENDEWVRFQGKDEQKAMHIDVAQLSKYIDYVKEDVNTWKSVFEGYKDSLFLTYEDITQAGFDWSQVREFVGLERMSVPAKANTKKIIQGYSFIDNLEEIKTTLASEENGQI